MNYTLITGATGGIGQALAQEFARHGHSLILLGRNINHLESLTQQLSILYPNLSFHYYAVDLADTEKLITTLSTICAHHPVDIVINNAGIGRFEAVQDLSEEAIDAQLDINLKAPMLITRFFLNQLIERRGALIYIGSILSDLPNQKASVYAASKHGLLGFANTVRLEHPELYVLTVHPSTVRTHFFGKMVTGKFVLEPETVAQKTYRAFKRRKRRLNIPKSIGLLRLCYLFFPRLIDRINRRFFTNK